MKNYWLNLKSSRNKFKVTILGSGCNSQFVDISKVSWSQSRLYLKVKFKSNDIIIWLDSGSKFHTYHAVNIDVIRPDLPIYCYHLKLQISITDVKSRSLPSTNVFFNIEPQLDYLHRQMRSDRNIPWIPWGDFST